MPRYVLTPSRVIEPLLFKIRDMVFKGFSKRDILSAASKVAGRRSQATIQTHYDYAVGLKHAAQRLNQSGPNRPVSEVLESSKSTRPQSYRVGYTFEFVNPKTGKYRKAGFKVDIEPGFTKQQTLALIRQQMLDWLSQSYERRDDSGESKTARWRRLNITDIEGV